MVVVAPELTHVRSTPLATYESLGGPIYGLAPTIGSWRVRLSDNWLVSFGRTMSTAGYKLGFNVWEVEDDVWDNPFLRIRSTTETNDGTLQIATTANGGVTNGRVWWNSTSRRLAWLIPEVVDLSGNLDVNQFAYGLVEFSRTGDATVINSGTLTVTGAAGVYDSKSNLLLIASTDLETIAAVVSNSQGTGTAGNRARLQTNAFDLASGSGGTWSAQTMVPTTLGVADLDPNNWYGWELGVTRNYTAVGDAGSSVQAIVDAGGVAAAAHDWPGGSATDIIDFVVDRRTPFKNRQVIGPDIYEGQHVNAGYEAVLYDNVGGTVPSWAPYLDTLTELCDYFGGGGVEACGHVGTKDTFLEVTDGLTNVVTQFQMRPANGTTALRTNDAGGYRWNYGTSDASVQLFYQVAVEPTPATPLVLPDLALPKLVIPFRDIARTPDSGAT